MSHIVVASFRLGETDGVSIEAAKWIAALQRNGHDVTSVAGEGHADVLIPGLAMHAQRPPTLEEVRRPLEQCDIAIIENMLQKIYTLKTK